MIHILTGAPCSGKSTYVEQNAKAGDLVVDFDKIAVVLGSADAHDAKGIVREAAFSARSEAIETALKNPTAESWIIHTFPTAEQLLTYDEAGAEFVYLDADRETCLERAQADKRPQATIDGINKYFAEAKSNDMEHKTKSFNLKADAETGMIAGYFSTYDRVPDSYGDIIEPGAFTETIKKREESGHPFPLCWNHDFSAVIGAVDSIKDTEKGPYIEAHFLDTQLAQDVRKMVQSGAVYQFSFAYDVLDSHAPTAEEKADGIENVLTKLEVFEISVVTVPANQNAVATEVKSGKRNSKADEDVIRENIRELADSVDDLNALAQALTNRIESLGSLLDEPGADDTEEEEPTPVEEAQVEVNEVETSEEPKTEGNAKRAEELLTRIKNITGGSDL